VDGRDRRSRGRRARRRGPLRNLSRRRAAKRLHAGLASDR
jgi:hypothetical protein